MSLVCSWCLSWAVSGHDRYTWTITSLMETCRKLPTHTPQHCRQIVHTLSCICGNISIFYLGTGAGCSSVDSMPAFEAVGRRIDPSQWTQLQFGLFSVPTSGTQLVYQRPWYVLFCLWKSAYKRSLAAYRKE